jgi:hypothetical protein
MTPVVLTVAMLGADVPYVIVAAEARGPAAEAVRACVPPCASETELGCTFNVVRPGARSETVIVTAWLIVAVVKPAAVPVAETVMVATPGATAVTTPAAVTDAIVADELVYVYVAVRPAGCTVGTIVTEPPTANCAADGDTASDVMAGAGADTETDAAADWPVEAAAVIVALPAATAVTRQAEPDTVAVATVAELEVQLASVGAPVLGPPEICTAKFTDSPMFILAEGGVMDSVIGAAGATGTVTSSPQAPSAKAPRLRAMIALFREKSCINPPLSRSWR